MTKRRQRYCEWCDVGLQRPKIETETTRGVGQKRYCSAACQLYARAKRVGDCWEFQGSTDGHGYGQLTMHMPGGKKIIKAYRAAYLCFIGDLPEGKNYVCHTCDNRMCFNPRHLFAGTCADNAQDASAKGRTAIAERLPQTRLERGQVIAIKSAIRSGATNDELARQYNVSRGAIYQIRINKNWKHVA